MTNEIEPIDSLNLWESVLEIISNNLSKPTYQTWIEPLNGKMINEETLLITAPNEMIQEWVEVRYKKLFISALYDLTGREINIRVNSVEEPNTGKNDIEDDIKKLASKYGIEDEDFLKGLEDLITKYDKTLKRLSER